MLSISLWIFLFSLSLFLLPTGPGGWGAINRLDYSYDDFVEVDSEEQQPKLGSDSMDVANSRVKRHKKINMPMSDHKIKLIFNVTGMRIFLSLLLLGKMEYTFLKWGLF